MAHPFVWVELHTQDPGKAKAFYRDLFGWKVNEVPMGSAGTYNMLEIGEGPGGGIMKNPVPSAPAHWLTYVKVDDVAMAAQKAQGLGAKVVQPKTEVPGFGWLSVITDPTGAVLGLWQPKGN